jgi:hypothetical protein
VAECLPLAAECQSPDSGRKNEITDRLRETTVFGHDLSRMPPRRPFARELAALRSLVRRPTNEPTPND